MQLTNEALRQIDETSGSGAATARTIVQAGINESYAEIAGIRDWETLENSDTVTTASGTQEYTPITSSTSVPRIRRIESVLDETNNRALNEVKREEFERLYPYIDTSSAQNQGDPIYWYISGYDSNRDIKIKLFPVPDSALTLRPHWIEEPVELAADADVPRIPDQFHYGLTYLGIAKYYEFQKDPIANYYRSLHDQYKQKILTIEFSPSDEMPAFQPQGRDRAFVTGKIGRVYN